MHQQSLSRARPPRRRRVLLTLAIVFTMLGVSPALSGYGGFGAAPARADSYAVVSGAGSTWSQVAIDAWRTNIRKAGVIVNYAGTGSTDGRNQFRFGTVDFGVSEIPFQLHPEDGSAPEISPRPFAYLPIVAGGTSFMYHISVGGKLITDLRLSGETLGKIFTGVITNWDDPQITHDYGHQLPSKTITPVVRADGSGTSAQWSLYLATKYPTLWNAFCQKYAGQKPPCGLTSFWPQFPGSKAQTGSNLVANYVAASYGDGAIGYDEYAYAKARSYPVVALLNDAGYYVTPTASNVAIALTGAHINSDLTQNLNGVYDNRDPRTYPLSSYSYMIVPTTTAAPFNADKGRTLSTFINYFLCGGQQFADSLGYSPLPANLVQAGFDQVRRIPGMVSPPTLSSCNNPAFQLLKTAPLPLACQKAGSSGCSNLGIPGKTTSGPPTTGSGRTGNSGTGNGGSGGNGSGGTGSGTGTSGSGSTAGTGASGSTTGAGQGNSGTGAVDPETGQTGNSTTTAADGSGATAAVVDMGPAQNAAATRALYGLSALEFLLVLVVPPVGYLLWQRRRRMLGQK